MPTSPREDIEQVLNDHDFSVVVYYRGHWCPFCRAWLHELELLKDSISRRNGATIAITAEDESKMPEMHRLSGYTGEIISDPDHTVADFLRNDGLLDVAVTARSGYAHGMAQPAILILRRDHTSLYHWAIVPSTMNLGGAKDRPNLSQVMENVFAQLDGQKPVHSTIKLQTFWQGISTKIFGVKV